MRQVFEPISTMGTNILASDLTAAVSEYVKDVILNNITIDPAPTGNPQDGTLGISLAFSLADAGLANTGTTQTEVNMMIGAQQ